MKKTKLERVLEVIKNNYNYEEEFDLNKVRKDYERIFDEKIKTSTLSTYLARLCEEGILKRQGNRGGYIYRIKSPELGAPAGNFFDY